MTKKVYLTEAQLQNVVENTIKRILDESNIDEDVFKHFFRGVSGSYGKEKSTNPLADLKNNIDGTIRVFFSSFEETKQALIKMQSLLQRYKFYSKNPNQIDVSISRYKQASTFMDKAYAALKGKKQ